MPVMNICGAEERKIGQQARFKSDVKRKFTETQHLHFRCLKKQTFTERQRLVSDETSPEAKLYWS